MRWQDWSRLSLGVVGIVKHFVNICGKGGEWFNYLQEQAVFVKIVCRNMQDWSRQSTGADKIVRSVWWGR